MYIYLKSLIVKEIKTESKHEPSWPRHKARWQAKHGAKRQVLQSSCTGSALRPSPRRLLTVDGTQKQLRMSFVIFVYDQIHSVVLEEVIPQVTENRITTSKA